MVEPVQGDFEYSEENAKQGIRTIALNADMLEQTAANLKLADHFMSPSTKQSALGIKIERKRDDNDYKLLINGATIRVDNNRGIENGEYEAISNRAMAEANHIVAHVVDTLEMAGKLAHEVHMDHRKLNEHERKQIAALPEVLGQAQALLDAFVKGVEIIPDNKERMIQANAMPIFLASLLLNLAIPARK